MLQHQARLWNLLHTNALISTCQRHVPCASHDTTIKHAHACHAMQLDVYYRWLKIVTQIDIATCLWARYILMINSIPSAQMQTTHMRHATCDMRHATCDCDVRHAMRRYADSMRLRHATSDASDVNQSWVWNWRWRHACTYLVLQSDGCRTLDSGCAGSFRLHFQPSNRCLIQSVKYQYVHISTSVQIADIMRRR